MGRPLRIAFVMRHVGYVRHYELPIRELARRGHQVTLLFTAAKPGLDDSIVFDIQRDHPDHVDHRVVEPRQDRFAATLTALRAKRDYLRYLHPRYRAAEKLRTRAGARLSVLARWNLRCRVGSSPHRIATMSERLGRVIDRIPADPALVDTLRPIEPDIVLVTPLVDFGSGEVEYQRAASWLGCPVGYCVASWDNLTNKGIVHHPPDAVILWNDAQRQEAIELHGIPAERIHVTGAQLFDQWFDRRPAKSREAFCRQLAFDPERPILLFLCSSGFITDNDIDVVRLWIAAVRASDDEAVRNASVLIRPHPANLKHWQCEAECVETDRVAGRVRVWPLENRLRIDAATHDSYFDSLFHASVAVGVNTSAFIEAAILDRPCLALEFDEFAATQQGTLHYRHLIDDGPLTTSKDLDEHIAQLTALLAGDDPERIARRRFLERFVRPRGRDRAATPFVVDAIESLTRTSRQIRVARVGGGRDEGAGA